MSEKILKNERNHAKRDSRLNSEQNNPCLQEQKLSYDCLKENSYDQDACYAYFANYTVCKKFWTHIMQERRVKGIEPDLPPPEERIKIKTEYFASIGKSQ